MQKRLLRTHSNMSVTLISNHNYWVTTHTQFYLSILAGFISFCQKNKKGANFTFVSLGFSNWDIWSNWVLYHIFFPAICHSAHKIWVYLKTRSWSPLSLLLYNWFSFDLSSECLAFNCTEIYKAGGESLWLT